jgi:CheY-like chemotaxis protein
MLERPDLCDVPVVVLTARGYALGDEASELRNVRAVLSKPFSPRAILNEVATILGDQEQAA